MTNVNYLLGELFCGPGGIAIGAKNAKTRVNGSQYTIEHAWAME